MITAWPHLDALTAHIVNHHHRYVREITPVLAGWLSELASSSGNRHPELLTLQATFEALSAELGTHMVKEEHILFPFVDALAVAARSDARLPPGPFGTVLNPIRVMEEDHRRAAGQVASLRALTANYTPPDDASATHRRCYAELATYEADFHRHVDLESQVLFAGAIDLERRLTPS